MFTKCHIILYVKDQNISTVFYSTVFQRQPDLHVPGMTEFHLFSDMVLGLMPESGIMRLLGDRLPDPSTAWGVPRSELYVLVDDPEAYHRRALQAGAKNLSDLNLRDWGDEAAYCLDLDSHVLAFARRLG